MQLFLIVLVLSTKHKQNIEIMKTSIKSLFTTSLIALTISTSTIYAADRKKAAKENTVAATAVNISSINKLSVSGNVEVTLVQNAKSKTLFTNEGDEHVTVKKVGNALYINSDSRSRAGKVTVYVDDIYRIEAADNAYIVTEKPLNLKNLQVFTKDFATVSLNSKTGALFTKIADNSSLDLKGSTDSYIIEMDKSAKFNLDNFKSAKTEMKSEVIVTSRR